jgi:succinoglycan biosynthesis transport protein ExoP
VRALETLALDQSRDQVTVRQLEREAEASRILYQNFLSRLQETSEQERLEEPDVRILTRAEPPFSPQTQRQNRTLAVSLIAGRLPGSASSSCWTSSTTPSARHRSWSR